MKKSYVLYAQTSKCFYKMVRVEALEREISMKQIIHEALEAYLEQEEN